MYVLFWILVNVGDHPYFTNINLSFLYSLNYWLILFSASEVRKQTHIFKGSWFRWKASVWAFVEANQIKKHKAMHSLYSRCRELPLFSLTWRKNMRLDICFIESYAYFHNFIFQFLRSAWQALRSGRIHCGFRCTRAQEGRRTIFATPAVRKNYYRNSCRTVGWNVYDYGKR